MSGWLKGLLLAVFCVFVAGLLILLLDRLFPPPLDQVRVSTIITDQNGQWLHAFTVDEQGEKRWRLAADLDHIDPSFIERLVAVEDKRFFSHHGVDFAAIVRATKSMVASGRIVSGASTITMQTARLMEPRPRTIPSKVIEMVRAMQIEARLSKREILELYLTLAPYGGNLEGVRAASLAYFGKEPDALSDAEQALLIALPQAPEARRPDRRPQNAKAARAVILQKLNRIGLVSTPLQREANEEALPTRRQSPPRHALHLSYSLRRNATSDKAGRIITNLDYELQMFAEQMAARYSRQSGDNANMAILIVESQSGAVKAHVGSANVALNGGWIDMMRAARSPGSTLKPFIYGIAFEDGAASRETLIDDAPYSFGNYRPENFSKIFHGDVTVEEALQHSLNVPAVLALDRIGPRRFVSLIESTGATMMVPKRADDKASLAIALGGVGFTGQDLAMLYSSLARDGLVRQLSYLPDQTIKTRQQARVFLSAQTANRITDILRTAPAPAGRAPSLLSNSAPKVAFKTGTSYGFRDAWSAGYTDDYTVIVWTGHANGTPRPGNTGREAALPFLFDIFDRLETVSEPLREQANDKAIFAELNALDSDKIGSGLKRLAPQKSSLPPEIVFPQDGVELILTARAQADGFSLSARGGHGPYRWFVDGETIEPEAGQARPIWYPQEAGFYHIILVDQNGTSTQASVRVR